MSLTPCRRPPRPGATVDRGVLSSDPGDLDDPAGLEVAVLILLWPDNAVRTSLDHHDSAGDCLAICRASAPAPTQKLNTPFHFFFTFNHKEIPNRNCHRFICMAVFGFGFGDILFKVKPSLEPERTKAELKLLVSSEFCCASSVSAAKPVCTEKVRSKETKQSKKNIDFTVTKSFLSGEALKFC